MPHTLPSTIEDLKKAFLEQRQTPAHPAKTSPAEATRKTEAIIDIVASLTMDKHGPPQNPADQAILDQAIVDFFSSARMTSGAIKFNALLGQLNMAVSEARRELAKSKNYDDIKAYAEHMHHKIRDLDLMRMVDPIAAAPTISAPGIHHSKPMAADSITNPSFSIKR